MIIAGLQLPAFAEATELWAVEDSRTYNNVQVRFHDFSGPDYEC